MIETLVETLLIPQQFVKEILHIKGKKSFIPSIFTYFNFCVDCL